MLNIKTLKPILIYTAFCAVLTVWSIIFFLLPFFLDNPVSDFRTVFTIILYLIALGIGNFFIIALIGVNKYTFACLYPIYNIAGAAVAFYRYAYKATISPVLIDASLHTNAGTIAGVISWQLVLYILLSTIFAVAAIVYRFKKITLPHPIICALTITLMLIGYYNANWYLKSALQQRYPYNISHNLVKYIEQEKLRKQERAQDNILSQRTDDEIDIILIIGESLRSDHLSINGYERETCPKLSKRSNLVSLPKLYSHYTHTLASVPHILTPADSTNYELANSTNSLISVLRNNDFYCSWISNQDRGTTYTSFIYEADTVIFPNVQKTVFVFDPWTDEDLIDPLNNLQNNRHKRNLYVLHCIGSHWYYNNHVSDNIDKFEPITTNRVITNNKPQEIINSYDNTVLEMDYVVDSIISIFQDKNAILFFISDHGEALGDDGCYLHANSSEKLHYPASFIWYSDLYKAKHEQEIENLHNHSSLPLRTDYLYHSLLGSAEIETTFYKSSLDILAE